MALVVAGTEYIQMPAGTTAQRPVAPAQGMQRYNTTLGYTEVYTGSAWVELVTNTSFLSSFTGANQSLVANGYQKIPGGLIFQWCESGSVASETTIAVTWPITFPNAVLRVVVGTKTGAGNSDLIAQLASQSTTGCVVNFNSLGSPQAVTAICFAIGY